MTNASIAVIGAGFSGTLLALQLQRRAMPGTQVLLIGRDQPFGPGLAYSTGNANHLLNVPAGRMSAFDDQPDGFLDWLQRQPAQILQGIDPRADAFVPRRLYGAYLRHLLNMALHQRSGTCIELLHANVTELEHGPHGLTLRCEAGESVGAAFAVLATGNPPPDPFPGAKHAPWWRPDPWAADAFAALDPQAPLLLIGSGLTMVDTVITLLDQGHTGPIHALSRRGLLPRRHAAVAPSAPPAVTDYPANIRALTAMLRRQAETAETWHDAIDGLRPWTQELWQRLSLTERRRLLRHLRPWWEVHRHRMAAQPAERIEAALQSRQLRIHAGHISSFDTTGRMVDVRFRPRGSESIATLQVARVVNCTGPGTDITRSQDPLMRGLLRMGMVRPDALRLGLDSTSTGALRDVTGAVSPRLFAVGPLTKATHWEITAVPDIRRQCATLAVHLAQRLLAPARSGYAERSARMHATPSFNAGTASAHAVTAIGQRVRNTQPDGGSDGLGGSPDSRIRDRRRAGSKLGTADSNARV